MLEVFKYIDKVKGLNYILEVARNRNITQSKLCEGIYDSSNFYKICKNPTEKNINSEKLRLLFAKLNIGRDEIMSNCTVFSKRTLELLHLIEGDGRAYNFTNYPCYIAELEELNEHPVVELQQFILWRKGVYEYSKNNYESAINYYKAALQISKPNYLEELEKKNRLSEVEIYVLNDLFLTEFFLDNDVETAKLLDKLLEIKPVYKQIYGYIQMNRIVTLIVLGKLSNASINLMNAYKRAKDNNQIGILALLNYLDATISNLINNDDSKLKKATLMLEAHGINVEDVKAFYKI